MRQISRDPFARETLLKSNYLDSSGTKTCDWCGSKRPDRYLYQYFTERDSINPRPVGIKGLFCSIACMRNYHAH